MGHVLALHVQSFLLSWLPRGAGVVPTPDQRPTTVHLHFRLPWPCCGYRDPLCVISGLFDSVSVQEKQPGSKACDIQENLPASGREGPHTGVTLEIAGRGSKREGFSTTCTDLLKTVLSDR